MRRASPPIAHVFFLVARSVVKIRPRLTKRGLYRHTASLLGSLTRVRICRSLGIHAAIGVRRYVPRSYVNHLRNIPLYFQRRPFVDELNT